MSMRISIVTLFSCCLFLSASWVRAEGKAPCIAFMGVEDPGFIFEDTDLDRFEKQVKAMLAKDGIAVVDAEKLQKHLGESTCRRAKCWAGLGDALGADKGLRLRIVRSGKLCTLVETLFDTTGRLTVEARMHESPCRPEAVLRSFEKTLPRLIFEETGWRRTAEKSETLPEQLSPEQIEHEFSKYESELQRCLDLQADRDPSVTGKLRIGFSIQPSGRIAQLRIVSQAHRTAFIGECMAYVFKSIHFPLFSGKAMPGLERQFQLGQ